MLAVVRYGPGVEMIHTHQLTSGAEAHVPAPPAMEAPLKLPRPSAKAIVPAPWRSPSLHSPA